MNTSPNLLLLEDDAFLRRINRTMLSGLGIKNVYLAGEGQEGLDILMRQQVE